MMVNIESLVRVARESNYVGFCTGVAIRKVGEKWHAFLLQRDDHPGQQSPHGVGDTPDQALQAAADRVVKWIDDSRSRAERELSERTALRNLLVGANP